MANHVFMPHGQNFLVRRLFESQTMEDEANQRENIFHGRCLIQGKVCLLNIDSGSCANMVSSRVVSKLNLVTKPHPTPYQLQWISEVGEISINKQVEIPFSIGKYEDVVLCDVVHMETIHMILGRPWQFEKRTIHDCFSNKITFVHQNRKVVLSSLSPKQAKEDQQRLREKLEEERNETLCKKQECESKSEGFCLDSSFPEEPLVHSDACLDVQELPKERSKTLPHMEPDGNEKNAPDLLIEPRIMSIDKKFHYFVISMTPLVISSLEPKMLHNKGSPREPSHLFRTSMIYVLLVSCNIANEWSNQGDDTKDGFERRVFDPGGLD
ncbi:hypothetical protein Lal_00044230 [Lupinus albus]|nr:hypothetical protein Lal_00044231 [Lupinus albus]KAF1854630.1 hypothetical protein Lal_00044232 [Lupinus albus]KAF1854631.1 hypothetical protein Lal_00044233 [Lupinus albus]KAF1854632.1 hypothetical protein Lal_00044234 [Lupinus albus]KAF1881758.1 hypothetical protein Lal_00044228 [Lupinus albus]